MKKVKKIPNCCSYNSPGFTYSQPFQTDAQMVLDLKLSYEHPPNGRRFFISMRGTIVASIAAVHTAASFYQATSVLHHRLLFRGEAPLRPLPFLSARAVSYDI